MVCVSAPGSDDDVFPAFHLRELTDDLQEVAEQATQGWDGIVSSFSTKPFTRETLDSLKFYFSSFPNIFRKNRKY